MVECGYESVCTLFWKDAIYVCKSHGSNCQWPRQRQKGELSVRWRQGADSILRLSVRACSISGSCPISMENENNHAEARSLIFDRNAEWQHSSILMIMLRHT